MYKLKQNIAIVNDFIESKRLLNNNEIYEAWDYIYDYLKHPLTEELRCPKCKKKKPIKIKRVCCDCNYEYDN